MAQDQLLKAVRITDDMKLEVYQQGKKRKYAIIYDGGNDYINNRRNNTENTKSEKYDVAMSDDDIIQEFLKRYNNWFYSAEKKYVITQNPYKDPAPVRTYGTGGTASPYYLNNGCAINIQWIGKIPNPEFNPGTYSNLYHAENAGEDNGKPRYLENVTITATSDAADNSNILPKSSWSVSPPITDGLFEPKEVPVDYRDTSYVQDKIVTVTLPNGFTENGGKGYLVWTQGGLQYDSKSIPENTPAQRILFDGQYIDVGYSKPKDQITYFSNSNKDSDIIEKVISDFESKVSSLHGIFRYELKLCAPNNEACSLVPYKSPLEPPVKANDLQTPVAATQSVPKIKFTIDGLGDDLQVKAKENLPDFTIWTGLIPKPKALTDDYDELSELDPIYSESLFAGNEEELAKITQANSIDDEPVGPVFDEQLAGEVDKSTIGSGPVLGSKLTNKSGTSMINLAGHRLTPILKDLENYLNKNGYPGAKIGNNGVMRDLRGSAYPSSPARATASLHGAGLAIDVTFNIPGFKWSGIGDNKNLATDANLTKVINNFIKGQGDITWGAAWGKGSNPASGIVNARGITEYHHMEIRADLIPKYWEPVKDELAKFGFKPTDLTSPGKGSGLHRLMLKLLGDTA
jgi:hypothetical protein